MHVRWICFSFQDLPSNPAAQENKAIVVFIGFHPIQIVLSHCLKTDLSNSWDQYVACLGWVHQSGLSPPVASWGPDMLIVALHTAYYIEFYCGKKARTKSHWERYSCCSSAKAYIVSNNIWGISPHLPLFCFVNIKSSYWSAIFIVQYTY